MKPWYKSKTIIFNTLGIIFLGVEQNFALLQPVLGANIYGIILFAVTVANIGLRVVTTTAVIR